MENIYWSAVCSMARARSAAAWRSETICDGSRPAESRCVAAAGYASSSSVSTSRPAALSFNAARCSGRRPCPSAF